MPHIFTTSYLTHAATEEFLRRQNNYDYPGPLLLSPGRSIGLRMIPMVRDLRFLWEEMPQQRLDEQQQKVRDSLRAALINWARAAGEGSDYTDNLPRQCLHPVGHWFEVPNLLRNGVLARLLAERPQLQHLMLHNIDTLGADADPAMFGLHLAQDACLTFEVITRRLEDRGGGLARVNGQVRLVEGLAMPREEDEFAPALLQFQHLLDPHRPAAGRLRPDPRRPGRRGKRRRRRPRPGRADADLHHHQGRQETLGPRPGRRLPRQPVRETVGGHDGAAGSEDALCRRAAPARPATQGPGPARRLAARRLGGVRRTNV